MSTTDQASLISPYGGQLVDLLVAPEGFEELKEQANRLPSLQISDRSLCDLECLAVGAFSPLDRFMSQADYQSVLETMRLADGTLFPVPVTLPIPDDFQVEAGQEIALRDSKNSLLAVLAVEELYSWRLDHEAERVYGTRDPRHPLVAEMHRWGRRNAAGRLRVLQLPLHHDFTDLRLAPRENRARLARFGRSDVVAFQTRNPLHRVHEELIRRALEQVDATLLLNPVVGLTRPGDFDHVTRVRSYRALSDYFDSGRTQLNLLPLAMRFAGPREAVWHALIVRNYGANHLIVGRGHASPGVDTEGRHFHPLYVAQELVREHREELGVEAVTFRDMVYLPEQQRYEEVTRLTGKSGRVSFSSRLFKEEYLDAGRSIPEWFARPEVASILTESHPPRHKQGVCIWFTGLSGAGKSTVAEILASMLAEHGRQVTVLDGDVVRTHLSKGLGFSAEDRDTNIRRIGWVAGSISKHGGTVICAAISPYRATRNDARNMVGPDNFVEVFVDTPLEVCEQRDVKGMYAKARRGEIKGFTGIDDPYEAPEHPEITLDTVGSTPAENARRIIDYLTEQHFLREGRR
ncbi:MAG: bifunctional sulfate adenylyltransferase/adenylylsulfate kinase [Acidobacteriota bacterium]